MNKKGVLQTIVTITILFMLLLIILLLVIGPEAILPKAADAANWIADNTLGGIKKDKFEKVTVTSDKNVEATYSSIINALRSSGTGPCLLSYKPSASDFKGSAITLSKVEQGIFIELKNKQGQNVIGETISGKAPCVVGEGTAAQNFYDNYLRGTICEPRCKPDYSIANIEFQDNSNIYVNGQKRGLRGENLLFKSKDGNVCFIPTYPGWFTSFGCDADKSGLDDDCATKIKNTLPICGKQTKRQFNACGAINYCYTEVTTYGNARVDLRCEDSPSQPTAYFKTKEDCIKGSECIKEHTLEITMKTCDDNNKEVDGLSGSFIWVWPKYLQR